MTTIVGGASRHVNRFPRAGKLARIRKSKTHPASLCHPAFLPPTSLRLLSHNPCHSPPSSAPQLLVETSNSIAPVRSVLSFNLPVEASVVPLPAASSLPSFRSKLPSRPYPQLPSLAADCKINIPHHYKSIRKTNVNIMNVKMLPANKLDNPSKHLFKVRERGGEGNSHDAKGQGTNQKQIGRSRRVNRKVGREEAAGTGYRVGSERGKGRAGVHGSFDPSLERKGREGRGVTKASTGSLEERLLRARVAESEAREGSCGQGRDGRFDWKHGREDAAGKGTTEASTERLEERTLRAGAVESEVSTRS